MSSDTAQTLARHKQSIWATPRKVVVSPTGLIGTFIVVVFVLTAALAPVIAPHNPNLQRPASRLLPPGSEDMEGNFFLLGTDNLGRDMLSRIMYGARVSVLVGVSAVLVAGAIGVTLGLVAGYFGDPLDAILGRIVDSFIAFPGLLLALVLAGVLGPGTTTVILVLGITNWVIYARVIRAEVLSLREREFVEAAHALGQRDHFILAKHVLPNVIPSYIVLATLNVADTIIAEAALSFLGLGVQPPVVSWGQMLAAGRSYVATSWWLATIPGLAITVVVLGIILMGDRLRDVLDPRMKGRGT